MNSRDAREILSLYRPGTEDERDPFFSEAKAQLASDPELARWFTEQRALDQAIADQLARTPVVGEEAARAVEKQLPIAQRIWYRRLGLAAAAVLVAVALFSSWRGPFQPAVTLADFRTEMVSFVKVPPNLEMESSELDYVRSWLAKNGALSDFSLPPVLAKLDPLGCRVLAFRQHKVTLVCFARGAGKTAHLFVVDRAAMPQLKPGAPAELGGVGEWMTAAWADGDRAYLLTAQGDETTLRRYLKS